ncbi:MAG: hypothetical protein K8823_970 [Cenarchaeum symbiont of Oopsacas minuta]|nr:hypothetical protein [Cenarchaeum symbiont of Oopsacas minuta]
MVIIFIEGELNRNRIIKILTKQHIPYWVHVPKQNIKSEQIIFKTDVKEIKLWKILKKSRDCNICHLTTCDIGKTKSSVTILNKLYDTKILSLIKNVYCISDIENRLCETPTPC